MNQIWFIRRQARRMEWRPSLLLFVLINMVTVVTALTSCVTMTIANKASYNCTALRISPINMNLAEGNTSIICETQPPKYEGEIYLLSFQYSSFKKWHRCNKASSCSMSFTLKENMEREILCTWRYNLSTTETEVVDRGEAHPGVQDSSLQHSPPSQFLSCPRLPLLPHKQQNTILLTLASLAAMYHFCIPALCQSEYCNARMPWKIHSLSNANNLKGPEFHK